MSQSNLANFFGDFSQKLKPIGTSITKQFTQAQQLARETIGAAGAGDVTELPAEYRQLEEKVDRVKAMHDSFLKVAKTYTMPHNDYNPPIEESLQGFASTMQGNMLGLARAAGVTSPLQPSPTNDIPKSLSHAISKVANDNGAVLGMNEPLGAALYKIASAHDKIGNAKVRMDDEVTAKFYEPLNITITQTIANAMKARKRVQSVRLTYDAARAALKTARPERSEALRTEMEKAEDEFVSAVDDAMSKMKSVVDGPETLKNLTDLVKAQLQYHKQAFEILSELGPEMEELVATNNALINSN